MWQQVALAPYTSLLIVISPLRSVLRVQKSRNNGAPKSMYSANEGLCEEVCHVSVMKLLLSYSGCRNKRESGVTW